mmetsp:Transcript_14504/g.46114  ORF Transcript_14504/g.46114 Transcript_14504/m.46114 type:complete len:322 (-) Transcript_14504:47-1012(-)
MATLATATALGATVLYCSQAYCAGPRRRTDGSGGAGLPRSRSRHIEKAPNTWAEALEVLAAALQWSFKETLGTWRTADLTIGLAYLVRKPLAPLQLRLEELSRERARGRGWIPEVRMLVRLLGFCMNIREKAPGKVVELFKDMGVPTEQVLAHHGFAGIMRPAFLLLRDEEHKQIVLVVRGTHSMKDTLTCINGAAQPHHAHVATHDAPPTPPGAVAGSSGRGGVVLGYAHSGMLAAARWINRHCLDALAEAMDECPGYSLKVVGHSLGGGTAVLLTMMLRESPAFREATCVSFACPACLTEELSRACAPYVTSIVNVRKS